MSSCLVRTWDPPGLLSSLALVLPRSRLLVVGFAGLAAVFWRRSRRRRWERVIARRFPRELCSDPRVQRALDPYPTAATVAMLADATGLLPRRLRKYAGGARDRRVFSRSKQQGGQLTNAVRRLEAQSFFYYMMHKPCGVVSTRDDESTGQRKESSRTVFDCLPSGYPHVPHVGRLDKETSGLLVFTDDGQLATRLLLRRPETEKCTKVYEVFVDGFTEDSLASLKTPLLDLTPNTREQVWTEPAFCALLTHEKDTALIQVRIAEGRKHQVRKLCARAGLQVVTLQRTHFGPLKLEGLDVGSVRPLTRDELDKCLDLVGIGRDSRTARLLPISTAEPPATLTRQDLDAALTDLAKRHQPS